MKIPLGFSLLLCIHCRICLLFIVLLILPSSALKASALSFIIPFFFLLLPLCVCTYTAVFQPFVFHFLSFVQKSQINYCPILFAGTNSDPFILLSIINMLLYKTLKFVFSVPCYRFSYVKRFHRPVLGLISTTSYAIKT